MIITRQWDEQYALAITLDTVVARAFERALSALAPQRYTRKNFPHAKHNHKSEVSFKSASEYKEVLECFVNKESILDGRVN